MELAAKNLSYSAVVVFMLVFDCILVNRLRRVPGFGKRQYWILTLLAATAVCALSDALCVYIGAGAGRTVTFLCGVFSPKLMEVFQKTRKQFEMLKK